jgi:hypothetical protein
MSTFSDTTIAAELRTLRRISSLALRTGKVPPNPYDYNPTEFSEQKLDLQSEAPTVTMQDTAVNNGNTVSDHGEIRDRGLSNTDIHWIWTPSTRSNSLCPGEAPASSFAVSDRGWAGGRLSAWMVAGMSASGPGLARRFP